MLHPSMGRFCGNRLPSVKASTNNKLLIRFVADTTVTKTGFRIKYYAKGEFYTLYNLSSLAEFWWSNVSTFLHNSDPQEIIFLWSMFSCESVQNSDKSKPCADHLRVEFKFFGYIFSTTNCTQKNPQKCVTVSWRQ